MANFGILAKIGADTSKFVSELKRAGDKGAGFGKQLGKVVKAGALVAGAALAAFATKGVIDFMDFEKKMTEVFTLLPGLTKEAEAKMSSDMRSLATTMGVDVVDATKALYQAISAGVPKENAADFLKIAAKAAIAGVSDLETSVAALTTILNGYSMGVEEAERVSDVLFSTVKFGVTNFTELGSNIGKVTPLAAELGVSIEEVGAMFATLTKTLGAGKTAEAGTAIRSMLAELAKEGMKAFENFVEASGTTFPNFIRSGGEVKDALKLMGEHAEKSGKGLMDMFRGVEAGMGALALAKNNTKDLGKALQDIKDDAGSTQTAYEQMAATTAMSWDKMKRKATEFGMSMGEVLLPLVSDIIEDIAGAFEWLAEKIKVATAWFAEHPNLLNNIRKSVVVFIAAVAGYNAVAILSAIATGALSAAIVIKNIAVGAASKAWKLLTIAMAANPIGAVIAAVTALVAIFVLWGDSAAEAAKKAKEEAVAFAAKWDKIAETSEKNTEKLIASAKKYAEQLADLRREKELEKQGNTVTETALVLARERAKLIEESIAEERKRPALIRASMAEEAKRFAMLQAGGADANQKLGFTAIQNASIKADKEAIAASQEKLNKLLVAEFKQTELVAKLTKEEADEEARRVQSLKDGLQILKDVAREHNLSQTELGKIVLKTDKLNALEKERAEILADLHEGNKGDIDSVERLAELEKDRLKTQKEIADILEGQVREAREAELEAIEGIKKGLDEELAAQEKIIDAEERKIELIQKQLDEQQKVVAAAEAAAAAVEEPFGANKTDFVTGEKIGIGEFKLSSAKLHREYRRLRDAGALPEGVRTLRDFQRHVEDNIRKARDELAKEKKKEKDLQDARDKADKEKKKAEKEANKIKDKLLAEELKIIGLRDKLNDKETKTLAQLTAERIRLEDALRQFRNIAQGAQIAIAPGLAGVMQGLKVELNKVAVAVEKTAEAAKPGSYEWDGKLYDAMTGELLKKTEDELEDSNEKLGDIRTRLEGFFVNQ